MTTFAEINDGPHTVARSQVHGWLAEVVAAAEPANPIVTRARVADSQVSWATPAPGYAPRVIDLPENGTPGEAPVGPFFSHEVDVVDLDEEGRPLNPAGRTGLAGRGVLPTWGATQAADLILTRHHPTTGRLEVLLIGRGDANAAAQARSERALPGGWVDPGETAAVAAVRELVEETGLTGITIAPGEVWEVFAGYVDDPRNTDHAWMETTAFHRHLTPAEAAAAVLPAGHQGLVEPGHTAPEITTVEWVEVTADLGGRMFASHRRLLGLATRRVPGPRVLSVGGFRDTAERPSSLAPATRAVQAAWDARAPRDLDELHELTAELKALLWELTPLTSRLATRLAALAEDPDLRTTPGYGNPRITALGAEDRVEQAARLIGRAGIEVDRARNTVTRLTLTPETTR